MKYWAAKRNKDNTNENILTSRLDSARWENKTHVEIEEAKVANFPSLGGGHGSVTLSLPHLQPFFGETTFLVDLDTAQLFIWFKKRWLRTGMSCSKVRYDTRSIEHYIEESSRKWRETYLKEEDTQLLVIRDLSKDFLKLPRTNTNQQKKKPFQIYQD